MSGGLSKRWQTVPAKNFAEEFTLEIVEVNPTVAFEVIDNLAFELPDTDAISVALGGRYQINESIDVGLSALYSMHKDRTIQNDSLDGEFTEGMYS